MAALTATVTLGSASCTVGQQVQVKVSVTNPNAYPVNLTEIKPTCVFTGDSIPVDGSSFYAANVVLGGALNQTVPASSSADFFFSLCPYQPSTGESDTGSGTYDVTCHISSNNQDYVTPTAATLTVHPVLPLF